jgi:hypothetical protein
LREFSTYLAATWVRCQSRAERATFMHFVPEWARTKPYLG